MSLINKMLRDLEARHPPEQDPPPEDAYRDLQPSRIGGDRSSEGGRRLVSTSLLAAAVLLAGYGAWLWSTRTVVPPPSLPAAGPVEAVPVPPPVAPVRPEPVRKADSKPSVVSRAKREPDSAPVVRPRPAPAVAESGHMEKTVKPLTAGEQAENLYSEAAALVSQGRGQEAESKLRAVLTADATHLRARELLTGILLQQGRTPEARALLEQGVEAAPAHTWFARLLARLYVENNTEAQAVVLLEKHAAAASQDADYLALLATLYQRNHRHADAIARYNQALTLRPQEGRWWMGLGLSCESDKKMDAAAQAYQRALGAALDPKLQAYVRARLAAVTAK